MDKIPPLFIEALVPGGVAFVTQLALAYAMGLKLPLPQLLGAMVVSGVFGGGSAIFLSEVCHLSPAAAGSLGAMSGMAPAVILSVLAVRVIAKKAGVNGEDFATVLPQMQEAMRGAAETKPTKEVQNVPSTDAHG